MNTNINTTSLCLKAVKRVVDHRITREITEYSGAVDVCTLSNGIQVGRLSTRIRDPHAYAMFIVGNFAINPTGPYGKAALSRLYACLCPEDCTTVTKIVLCVQNECIFSSGNHVRVISS